jgi:hypothetical protein
VVERDLRHARVTVGERGRRALDAQPLDEAEQRLARDGREHAVEVERREGRHAREVGERQPLREVRTDVVDDAVDAPLVLEAGRSRDAGAQYLLAIGSSSAGNSVMICAPPGVTMTSSSMRAAEVPSVAGQ